MIFGNSLLLLKELDEHSISGVLIETDLQQASDTHIRALALYMRAGAILAAGGLR